MPSLPSSALQDCLPRDSVNQIPKRLKSALWKSKVTVLLLALCIENSLHGQDGLQPSHHPQVLLCSNIRSSRVLALAGFLTSCIRKLFPHSPEISQTDSTALNFQKVSGKLKPHTRTSQERLGFMRLFPAVYRTFHLSLYPF